ncbi:MAG: ATP--guanido phosphotransferase [Fastidiosipila sp.]|nr:ATP--guanido phosphotransferase [Fastidiosipila sp.]
MSWYLDQGAEADVVVSSRVRLARNLSDTHFPWRLTAAEAKEVADRVGAAFNLIAEKTGRDSLNLPLDSLDDIDKLALAERRLISRNMLKSDLPRSLLLFSDEKSGVLVNEEDHLRIQTMRAGFALDDALSEADQLETALKESLTFAYDERLGYLTTCPTNTGTGLRVSVMLHVPLLMRKNLLNPLAKRLAKTGYTIRGATGEGSVAICDMVQISNQVTLGFNEKDILQGLSQLTRELISQERKYRQALQEEDTIAFEDEVQRAFGLLKYARRITFDETMDNLSSVRLGIAAGILEEVDYQSWQQIFIESGAGGIQRRAGRELSQTQINEERAQFVRNILNKKK